MEPPSSYSALLLVLLLVPFLPLSALEICISSHPLSPPRRPLPPPYAYSANGGGPPAGHSPAVADQENVKRVINRFFLFCRINWQILPFIHSKWIERQRAAYGRWRRRGRMD